MKNTNLNEILVSSERVFAGEFMQVMRDYVSLPNGRTAVREYIKHSGAAAIIAITTNQEIVLEYQYRHPVGKVMLEIPAGKLDPNEDDLAAAKRELFEETGYSSEKWTKLGTCLPCIGYSNEKITYFLAENVIPGSATLDEGELLETHLMPIDKFMQLAYSGQIEDSKTLAGLILYQGYKLRQI